MSCRCKSRPKAQNVFKRRYGTVRNIVSHVKTNHSICFQNAVAKTKGRLAYYLLNLNRQYKIKLVHRCSAGKKIPHSIFNMEQLLWLLNTLVKFIPIVLIWQLGSSSLHFWPFNWIGSVMCNSGQFAIFCASGKERTSRQNQK